MSVYNKSMYKKIFALIVIALFIYPNIVFAGVDLQDPWVSPNSFLYPIKRGWENFTESMTFSKNDKYEKSSELLKERLRELNYIVKNNKKSENQRASERYSYIAGVSVDNLISLKDKSKNDEMKNLMNSHEEVLGGLRDRYPANSSYWLLIQQNIDTLNILNQKIEDLPLN